MNDKELQALMDGLREENKNLSKEIATLKMSAGGLKGRNMQLRNIMQQHKAEWEEYTAKLRKAAEEAAHVYKSKIQDHVAEIKLLKDRITALEYSTEKLQNSNKRLQEENFVYKTNAEYFRALPWYKKIFHNIRSI